MFSYFSKLFSSESLDFWESFANWGSILVIVGVVGESLDIATHWYIRLGKKRPAKWVVRGLLPWESVFWLLLCIGLGMEFGGGWKSRLISREKNTILEWKASDAEQKAGDANKAAGEANKVAANAKEHAATLEKQAADAWLETERLRAQLAWRTITPTQRGTFKAITANLPKGKVILESGNADAEASYFGAQIGEMLHDSGYEIGGRLNSVSLFGGPPVIGVQIRVPSVEGQPMYAGPLQRALMAAGIDAVGQAGTMPGASFGTVGPTGSDSVVIFVGAKPPPQPVDSGK